MPAEAVALKAVWKCATNYHDSDSSEALVCVIDSYAVTYDNNGHGTKPDDTTAGLVGDFEWGPVNQVTRISDEARLKTYFGLPSNRNYKDWFTAKNYLEYSNSLSLVRVCLDSARNAFFKPDI